jgi:DNA polymerase delta subunit 1
MEKGEVRVPGVTAPLERPFEANIDFEIRFMADAQVVGCNWIELPAGAWTPRAKKDFKSRAQIEVDVAWNKLVSHAPEVSPTDCC